MSVKITKTHPTYILAEPIKKDRTESGILLPEGSQKLPLAKIYEPGPAAWLSKGDIVVVESSNGKAIFEIGKLNLIRLFPDEVVCVIEEGV
jgi:hypothetical protein